MAEILLVDDKESVLRATRRMLAGGGHSVTVVHSAEAALILLSRSGFDLVMSDYNMPGMNGLGVLMHLREDMHNTTPFAFYTTKDFPEQTEEIRRACLKYGASLIFKEERGLLQAVEQALLKHPAH